MDSWRYSGFPRIFLCIYNIYVGVGIYIYTLPETNIASDNRPSQKESHLITIDFQGIR